MRWGLATAIVALVTAVSTHAVGANYCAPAERWVDMVETVQVQVPVTTYVDEPYQVRSTRMVPVDEYVMVPQRRWVNETRTVPCTRTVYETETYVVNETRYENRPQTRYRKVNRTVREMEARTVTRKVCEQVCDPATGRTRTVTRKVCDTEMVPVKRKICVEEPYTVNVRCPVTVPVTKTRRVARQVPATRQVSERRCVTDMVRQKVTRMQPVEETRTVMRKKAVCTTRTEERQVVRRVRAPEPPCDPCGIR